MNADERGRQKEIPMTTKTIPVPMGRPSFLGMPRCGDLETLDADIAIIGVPFSYPYTMAAETWLSGSAPAAIREQSLRLAGTLSHYNFEFDGKLLGEREVRIADCGDVAMQPGQFEENNRAVTEAIQAILARGAFPIVLGGDHGVTAPVLGAYEGHGPLCAVQFDAHLDWRDEVNGVRFGQSSPMRRASEMPWVRAMIQIGLRGAGSARQAEIDAACQFGSILVRAEELHRVGVDEVLRRLPAAKAYYISVDADGLEASIAPGVGFPSFGGLTYWEAVNLLRGVAQRGKVAGFDLVEVVPSLDVGSSTSLLSAQLILTMIGALAHTGQIGSKGNMPSR